MMMMMIGTNNLGAKCMDNSGVAEHHQHQRQQVGDKEREESDTFLHGFAVVYRKPYALSLHDISRQCCESDLTRWDDDPDKCDCSVHEMLLNIQLQNAHDSTILFCILNYKLQFYKKTRKRVIS